MRCAGEDDAHLAAPRASCIGERREFSFLEEDLGTAPISASARSTSRECILLSADATSGRPQALYATAAPTSMMNSRRLTLAPIDASGPEYHSSGRRLLRREERG